MERKSKQVEKFALLSFDAEEFDIPREQGKTIPFEEQIKVSSDGLSSVLDILQSEGVHATFFCTTNLLLNTPKLAQRIIAEGHEIASHGCNHADPQPRHVAESKRMIEREYQVTVNGYRQPRMFSVGNEILRAEGYLYNSSLNPAFVPGRYMHLNVPRTPFFDQNVLQIPASVTPFLRIPLFWLSLHHLPVWMYEALVRHTLRHDGVFNTYFHPWEFVKISGVPEFGVPYIIGHNSGLSMQKRLIHLINMLKDEDAHFITYREFVSVWFATKK